MKNEKIRRMLRGEGITPGMAMGPAYVFKTINLEALEHNAFEIESVEIELERLELALERSRRQLDELSERALPAIREIYAVQSTLLADGQIVEEIRRELAERQVNLEHIIAQKTRQLADQFDNMQHEYLAVRFQDVEDAYHRMLRNLLEIEHVRTNPLRKAGEPAVIVARKLLPSDIAIIDMSKVVGIVMEQGSSMSHAAIVARAMEIPTVLQVKDAVAVINHGDDILVNGLHGTVIVHPRERDLQSLQEWRRSSGVGKPMESTAPTPATTSDAVTVRLEANVGSVAEAVRAARVGATGVGLLRTELLFMGREFMPNEDEEIEAYRSIFAVQEGRPVTVRLLDLGADKRVPYLPFDDEDNPQLGCRGIRYLLHRPELLRRQVRAILQAGKDHELRLLLPFVSVGEDLEEVIELIEEERTSLGIPRESYRLGAMVEVPSAALGLEPLISHLDFVSIGTNDLVQYIFAAAREGSTVDKYRQQFHPVILRLVSSVVETAKSSGRRVTICGESAGDLRMSLLLIGLGVRTLSVSPGRIANLRDRINRFDTTQAEAIAREAMQMGRENEVIAAAEALLDRWKIQRPWS